VEDRDTILGISIGNSVEQDDVKTIITSESTLLDFVSVLLNRVIKNIMFSNEDAGIIKYEMCFFTQITTMDSILRIVSSKEERKSMIESGQKKAAEYYDSLDLLFSYYSCFSKAVCTNLSKESFVIFASKSMV
jgi:hypothetical protein